MVSKYLECNTLHITDVAALNKLHALFISNEKTNCPISQYKKSSEEVEYFLKSKKKGKK